MGRLTTDLTSELQSELAKAQYKVVNMDQGYIKNSLL